jgi:AcrR family transcriptional regulator
MTSTAPNPLHRSQPERRRLLSRHFIAVIEPLLEAGEPYAELSVERIIKAGNIARSTFYAYFDDKGDLLSAMAEDVIGDLFEAGRTWWAFPHDGSKADLRAALTPALTTHRAHHTILGAVAEAAAYDSRARERYNLLIDEVVANLTEHIRRGQRQGSACPDLDPKRTAQWLIWMHERGLYQLVSPADEREAEKLLATLTDIVWRTLYEGFRSA